VHTVISRQPRQRGPVPRRDVIERDAGRCQRCGAVVLSAARSVHHRLARSRGGRDNPANLILLCGTGTAGCHGWVHAHPRQARATGLTVMTGRDPALVPVLTGPRGEVLLGDDWTVTPAL